MSAPAEPVRAVAVYRRRIPASLARVFENVLDWEHLPWLHRSTFSDIELESAGRWGWSARVALAPRERGAEARLEVRLDRPRLRYVTRTVAGLGAGTEIVTRLRPAGERATDIEVAFHVPGVPADRTGAVGEAYVRLYTRLWDEDVAMMLRRQARLDAGRQRAAPGAEPLRLGPVADLRASLPRVVEARGRRYRIIAWEGELLAHPVDCPHLGGPLDEAEVETGCVVCPWHGYRFRLRDGAEAHGRPFSLGDLPEVRIDPERGEASLHWRP